MITNSRHCAIYILGVGDYLNSRIPFPRDIKSSWLRAKADMRV
jgi:hypothetical protein